MKLLIKYDGGFKDGNVKKEKKLKFKEEQYSERYCNMIDSITSDVKPLDKRLKNTQKKSKLFKKKGIETSDSLLYTPYATQVINEVTQTKLSIKKNKESNFSLKEHMKPKYAEDSLRKQTKFKIKLSDFQRKLRGIQNMARDVNMDDNGEIKLRGSSCEACRIYDLN